MIGAAFYGRDMSAMCGGSPRLYQPYGHYFGRRPLAALKSD